LYFAGFYVAKKFCGRQKTPLFFGEIAQSDALCFVEFADSFARGEEF
jgi:hypothetical protein